MTFGKRTSAIILGGNSKLEFTFGEVIKLKLVNQTKFLFYLSFLLFETGKVYLLISGNVYSYNEVTSFSVVVSHTDTVFFFEKQSPHFHQ